MLNCFPFLVKTCRSVSRLCNKSPLFGNQSIKKKFSSRLSSCLHVFKPHIMPTKSESGKKNSVAKPTIWGILSFLGLKKEEKEPELIRTMKYGILATQNFEYNKADQLFHLALKMAQEQQNKEAVTYIYDLLANLKFETEDYFAAEKLFVAVMARLLIAGVTEEDNKLIHISLKVARIYDNTEQLDKAEDGYLFCVEKLEKKLEKAYAEMDRDTILLWSLTCQWYAQYLVQGKRIMESYEYLKKAYDASVAVNGKHDKTSLLMLNDMGALANELGDRPTALMYLKEAVEIADAHPEMSETAAIYVNLGMQYFDESLITQARMYCCKGLRLAKEKEDKSSEEEANECLQILNDYLKRY